MKVAVVSESSADEAAIRILVDAVLATRTIPYDPALRHRGWPAVLRSLPAVITHLHYRTDVDGLAVVADSDGEPLDDSARCRLVQMRREADRIVAGLRAVAGRAELKIAVGMAVPAIEAWYLCGRLPEATEAYWVGRLADGADGSQQRKHKMHLKHQAYGSHRPSLQRETRMAVEHARRVCKKIDEMRAAFPFGFGALHDDLKQW
jgi:hypothetical protein